MTRIDNSETPGDGVDASGPDHGLGSLRLWNVVAAVVLVVGLAMTAVGAVAWHGYVQGQADHTFDSNASSISAAVSTSLRRDIDFVATQRAGIIALPDLTNRELDLFYRSLDIGARFPGGATFIDLRKRLWGTGRAGQHPWSELGNRGGDAP